MPNIRKRGCIATMRRSPGRRTQEDRRSSPQVKTVSMIYVTHIPKRERKRALRDVYAIEPTIPTPNDWLA